MQKNLLFFCLLFSLDCRATSVDEDYTIYHGMINRAEEAMFLRDDYRAAAKHYDSAFSIFSFIYSKDCLIAAQLALVNGDRKRAMKYLHKGFEAGLKVRDLQVLKWFDTENGSHRTIAVFDSLLAQPGMRKLLEKDYSGAHKKYIARINVPLRITMDSVFIFDQLSKNNQRGTIAADPAFQFVENRLDGFYDSLIRAVGFPGEKLIGLDDTDMMADLGRRELDILQIYDRQYAADAAKYHVRRNQFGLDRSLSTLVTFVPLLHNSCAYRNLEKYFAVEIGKGNLHPRDAAYLLDFFQRPESGDDARHACRRSDMPMSFYTNARNPLAAGADLSQVNGRRQAMNIVPMEVDQAKGRYAKKHSLVLFFGFFNHL